ncbi:MAG: extracellular solute-binding protein [Bacillales bacterium]|jgi:ABC-type glycerol-3-phosphate transport system substrate-binding protein|nr:extracellular solute-binding protein [Bacillales bacterium]
MKKTNYVVLGLSVFLLSGCIPPPPSSAIDNSEEVSYSVPTSEEIDYNVVDTLSIMIPQGNSNETTMIDSAIVGFNDIYPNVTFEKKYLSHANYESTVRNQFIANTLPDIVWSNSPDFLFLVDKGIALPLNPYINNAIEQGEFDLERDFYTQFLDMGKKGANYYCIPRSQDSVVTFYNRDLIRKVGGDDLLAYIQNGWTWDDFLVVCDAVRKYQNNLNRFDYYAVDMNITGWLSVSYPILRSFGGEILNSEGELVIDSAETRQALNVVHEMVTKGYAVSSGQTSGSSFEVGTSAFLFQSAAVSLFSERAALKGKIDIVSFPRLGPTPKIGAGIAGYTINSKSTRKDLSWAFIQHLISYEGQQQMADGGLVLPSIRKDLTDPETANWLKGWDDFNMDAYLYGSEYKITAEFLSYVDTKYKSGLDLATNDLFNNVSNKDKDVEQSLQKGILLFLEELEQ